MPSAAVEMFSTFGVAVLCIVLGIMALAIFFGLFSKSDPQGEKPDALAIRGILKKDTWATVHTTGGEIFKRVKFIGYTSTENFKSNLPYDLHGMVILEDPEQRRTLIRAKAIRKIEVAPDQNT